MAIRVVGRNGLHGTVLDPPPSANNDTARVRIEPEGRVIELPASMLSKKEDGSYEVPLGPSDIERDETVVPVLAEELDVQKRQVPTGGVRVHRRTVEHDETVELPLLREHVDVRHVVVNRLVDGPMPVRKEGDTTIVPVVEEELVIQKRFVLKEEIHVTRTMTEETRQKNVTLRRQEAVIEHLDAEGRPTAARRQEEPPPPPRPVQREAEPPPRRQPRRSILGE